MFRDAEVNCIACAVVSLLARRICSTTPSNTRSEAQAICRRLFCRAILAASNGALSTTLTAVDIGNPSTVAISAVVCCSAVAVTVTVKLQLFCNPALSVAVQVTGVLPIGKVEPDDGVHLGGTAPQVSRVVGEKLITAPLQLFQISLLTKSPDVNFKT